MIPRTTLEQWRVLQAIVDYGGFAQAAQELHRSQSSVSYAVARLQEQVGVPLLEQEGRRMQLTPAGAVLLREAKGLLDGMLELERRAKVLEKGWEPVVRFAVDGLYPTTLLLQVLELFSVQYPNTRVQVHEVVMSGADEALYEGDVDLAVVHRLPQGFLGDWLIDVEMIAVAVPEHELFTVNRDLISDDLVPHNQVVVRDSGHRHPRNDGWLGAERRWTVSNPQTAVMVVEAGLGFAWLPVCRIQQQLMEGRLKPLPLLTGQIRRGSLHLVIADPRQVGEAVKALAECFQNIPLPDYIVCTKELTF